MHLVPGRGHLGCHCSRGREREWKNHKDSPGTEPQQLASGPLPIDADDEAGLISALADRNAGRTIRLLSREYTVNKTLVVPDGMTLQGAGVMLFDDQGLPVKFKQGTTTTITAKNPTSRATS
jgi:hypothetical protein